MGGLAVSAGIVALSAMPVFAQEQMSSDSDGMMVLEEILVTASRRGTETLQTTPVAITALTTDAIEKYNPRDLNDITFMVPGLSGGNVAGFKSSSFAMRGVTENTIIVYKESPVGVTIDDFVVPHIQTSNLEMFDIEQIEILRGPQGTLFGKNTTAGVVNVRTKRPVLNETSIDVRAKYGSFETAEGQLAVNIPLIEDKLAFRFAGMYLYSDGYYKNGASYGPLADFLPPDVAGTSVAGDGSRLGGDDVFSGRAKLLWQASDEFSAHLQYEMIRDSGESLPSVNESTANAVFTAWGYVAPTGDPLDYAGITNRDDLLMNMSEGHRVNIDGVYLNLDLDKGNYSFHSVTGYRYQESRLPSTYTGVPGPVSLFDATRDDNRKTFQQELRMASHLDGPFNFVTGVYYQQNDVDFCVLQLVGFLDNFGLGTPPGFFNNNPLVLCNKQDATAVAGFVDGTYDISDRLHLTVGARLTYEKKEWAGRSRLSIGEIAEDFSVTTDDLNEPLDLGDFSTYPFGVVSNENSWTEPTWRIVLGYDISDDTFGYISYNRGFKSGGYNDQVGTQLDLVAAVAAAAADDAIPDPTDPTNPEKADSFEIGIKSDFMNNRANIAVTGYYVKYSDAQRSLNASFPTGQETLYFNAAELEVYGLEVEGSLLVTDGLLLRANGSYTHAEFKSFEADTNFDGVIDVDLSGLPVDKTPEWMFSFDANYSHDLSDLGRLDWNVRLSYESEAISSYGDDVSGIPNVTLNEKTLIDASVTFTDSDDKYYVRLYGKNLTDERYRTGGLNVGGIWVMSSYGPPRYYGVELGFKFGS